MSHKRPTSTKQSHRQKNKEQENNMMIHESIDLSPFDWRFCSVFHEFGFMASEHNDAVGPSGVTEHCTTEKELVGVQGDFFSSQAEGSFKSVQAVVG